MPDRREFLEYREGRDQGRPSEIRVRHLLFQPLEQTLRQIRQVQKKRAQILVQGQLLSPVRSGVQSEEKLEQLSVRKVAVLVGLEHELQRAMFSGFL